MSGSCLNGHQIKLLNLAKAVLNILLNFRAGVEVYNNLNYIKIIVSSFPCPFDEHL